MDAFFSAVATSLSGNPWALITLVFIGGLFYVVKDVAGKLDPNKIADIYATVHGEAMVELKTILETVRKDQIVSNLQRAEQSVLLQQLKVDQESFSDSIKSLHDEQDELRKDIERIQLSVCANASTCASRAKT